MPVKIHVDGPKRKRGVVKIFTNNLKERRKS